MNNQPPPADPPDPIPRITFGLEQEFNFACSKTRFRTFDSLQEPFELTHPDDGLSSLATNSEKFHFKFSHLTYVLAILNHEIDFLPSYNQPSLLGKVKRAGPKAHGYDDFHLVLDDSVTPKWREQVKGIWGVDVKWALSSASRLAEAENIIQLKSNDPTRTLGDVKSSIEHNYDRVGCELVSKIYNFERLNDWKACLRQVQTDLAWDTTHDQGTWVDEDPHLHVHMAKSTGFTLRVAKHIIVLYGLFEVEIGRWHPASQRDSYFCKSMRGGTNMLPYTPHSFAQQIYRAFTWQALKDLTYDETNNPGFGIAPADPNQWKNYVQVNLSLARTGKNRTVEFRQHRGTLDAEEIKWWVRFCGHLFQHAMDLLEMKQFVANVDPSPSSDGDVDFLNNYVKMSILDHINFPQEGKDFFAAKAVEYDNAHYNRLRALDQMVIEERISRVGKGQKLGHAMEASIRASAWYEIEKQIFDAAERADDLEKHRRREIDRKHRDWSRRELRRQARVQLRQQQRQA